MQNQTSLSHVCLLPPRLRFTFLRQVQQDLLSKLILIEITARQRAPKYSPQIVITRFMPFELYIEYTLQEDHIKSQWFKTMEARFHTSMSQHHKHLLLLRPPKNKPYRDVSSLSGRQTADGKKLACLYRGRVFAWQRPPEYLKSIKILKTLTLIIKRIQKINASVYFIQTFPSFKD